ncbi:hypothetical protein L2E82_12080 [Cichorium intybus]|uniref:Uncharacterized protein n=1 Tax=Cichorium intybus TaxID=13427 RepID=A0ACB9GEY8_CICIN|nr:hypothetical protein L2E82_12080 [Cichorium intybus]
MTVGSHGHIRHFTFGNRLYNGLRVPLEKSRHTGFTYLFSNLQKPKITQDPKSLSRDIENLLRECREMRGDSRLFNHGRGKKSTGGRTCHRKHVEDG